MVVAGLENFMHSTPKCCETVNLKQLALAYSEKHQKSPELILDIDNNYIRYFFNKPWLSGGQMKELAHMLEIFLKKLQSFGIKVTAFIGGMADPNDHIRSRIVFFQTCRRAAVNNMFDSLHSNQPIKNYDKFLPNNIKSVIINTFKQCKCQIFQCVIKCNLEAAIYSKRNNCFGILSQDADFVIYNCADNYFSLERLNLDTFDTIRYRTDKLTEILELTPRELPLMASALGNAYISQATLKRFHLSLFEKHEHFSKHKTFHKVIAFLKKNVKRDQSLTSQINNLSKEFFGTHAKSYLLKGSLESYNINFPPKDDIICTNDDLWNQIRKIVVEEHKAAKFPYNVYQIVFHSMYFQRVDMEDPKNKNNQKWFEIAKELRRKIYGILLINKPHPKGRPVSIREFHIDSNAKEQTNYVEPIFPKMDVNLLELWSADGIYDDKWDLFCSTLNIQRNLLTLEEKQIFIPVASLNYLMMERFEIASWELKAILSSILLLQYYSVEDLEAIPEKPLDPNGIHLYWYLMKIFDLVAILNSICGFPLESDLVNPVHYQDGKLFHHKYRQAKNKISFENLCEYREKEIEIGTRVMAMICKRDLQSQ